MTSLAYEGWLTRKNQRQWCMIEDGVLYWFSGVQQRGADLARLSRGSVNLQACVSFYIHPSKHCSFQIETAGNMEYLFAADTQNELFQWFSKLRAAVIYEQSHLSRDLLAGLLSKKGQNRYCVLRPDRLSWYLTKEDGTPKGWLELSGCVCDEEPTDNSWSIQAPYMNSKYTFSCADHASALNWWQTTKSAVETARGKNQEKKNDMLSSLGTETLDPKKGVDLLDNRKKGWMQKDNRPRFCLLTKNLLTWYRQDPDLSSSDAVMLGSICLMSPSEVSIAGFSIHFYPPVGQPFDFLAPTKEEAEAWVRAIHAGIVAAKVAVDVPTTPAKNEGMSGWVIKKYVGGKKQHKRYLLLRKNEVVLYYYDSDNTDHPPKGEISLFCACVIQLDSLNFVVSTGSRDYPFQCNSSEKTISWVNTLTLFIQQAQTELAKYVYKHQWAVGGRTTSDRWLIISRSRQLHWFPHVATPEMLKAPDPANMIDLTGALVEKAQRPNALRIGPPNCEKILFCFSDEQNFNEWFNELSVIVKGTGEVKDKSLYFGCSLSSILAREGGLIPQFVELAVRYIKENGISQGIFRLSGATTEIKQYSAALDRGEMPDLSDPVAVDVNAVAGTLKMFVREMPDPLFHTELYHTFLDATTVPQLREAVMKLNPQHYRLAAFLFSFLKFLTGHAETTSMDAANLSIVFAPNVLRLPKDDLQDNTRILETTKMLILQCDAIFDSEPPPPVRPTTTLDHSIFLTSKVSTRNLAPSPSHKALASNVPPKKNTIPDGFLTLNSDRPQSPDSASQESEEYLKGFGHVGMDTLQANIDEILDELGLELPADFEIEL